MPALAVEKNEKPRAKSSPYAFFVKSCKDDFKKINPGSNMIGLSKKCSEEWKLISKEDRAEFQKLADLDKVRFDREMSAYSPPSPSTGEEKKRKRSAKEKDPNAPKRPLTAFFLFIGEKRAEVKEKNPTLSVGEVAKHLGSFWKNMTDQEKQRFVEQAEENKKIYKEKSDAYKNLCSKDSGGNANEDKENDSD